MYQSDCLNNPQNYAQIFKENNQDSETMALRIGQNLEDRFLQRKRNDNQIEKLKVEQVSLFYYLNKVQNLFRKLRLKNSHQFFDTLCFEQEIFEDLDKFLKMLDHVSDQNIFSQTVKIQNSGKILIAEDPAWFNPSSFQSCWYWIVRELEKSLAIQYRDHSQRKKLTMKKEIESDKNADLKIYWIKLDRIQRKNILNSGIEILRQQRQICIELNHDSKQRNKSINQEVETIWFWILQNMGSKLRLISESEMEQSLKIQFDTKVEGNIFDQCDGVSLSDTLDQTKYIAWKVMKLIDQYYKEKQVEELIKIEENEKIQIQFNKSKKNIKRKDKDAKKIKDKINESQSELNQREQIFQMSQSQDNKKSIQFVSVNQEDVKQTKSKRVVTRNTKFVFFTPPNSPYQILADHDKIHEKILSELEVLDLVKSKEILPDIEMQDLYIYNPIDFDKIFRELAADEPKLNIVLIESNVTHEDSMLTQIMSSRIMECCGIAPKEEQEFMRDQNLKQNERKKLLKKQRKKTQKYSEKKENSVSGSQQTNSVEPEFCATQHRQNDESLFDAWKGTDSLNISTIVEIPNDEPPKLESSIDAESLGLEKSSTDGKTVTSGQVNFDSQSFYNIASPHEQLNVIVNQAKSHQTNTTTAPTSEEEIIQIQQFGMVEQQGSVTFQDRFQKQQEDKSFEVKNKKQKFSKPYKSYTIKSDQSLQLSRSNTFSKHSKQEPEEIELECLFTQKLREIIPPIIQDDVKSERDKNLTADANNIQDKGMINISQASMTEDIEDEKDEQILMFVKNQAIDKLNQDIRQYSDKILDNFHRLLPYRMLIFNRIQFIVRSIFMNADIRLFGSCATGLALPDSDIDLGVLGFELLLRSQLQGPINALQDCLKSMKWVISSKAILTSSIPVLKIEIDPRISMEEQFFNQGFFNFYPTSADGGRQFNLTLTQIQNLIPLYDGPFQVDITFNQVSHNFDNQDHLGQVTTEMVRSWISQCSDLQHLVIIMKAIFKKKGMNQTYSGGLSSFAIIILVHAYLVEYKQKNHEKVNLGQLFIKMIDFYANQFDPLTTGINYINNDQSPYYDIPSYNGQSITVLSPLSSKSISGSCLYIQSIFGDFRNILKDFDQLIETYLDYHSLRRKKRIRKNQKDLFNLKCRTNFFEQTLAKLESITM